MTNINRLTSQDDVVSSDLVPVWASRNSATRQITIASLAAAIQALIQEATVAGISEEVTENVQAFLGGANGSSLIGFQQSGTGAVARTVQAKDREIVSLTDYYANGVSGAAADPTGALDNAGGLTAAIAALPVAGGDVNVPQGTWRLNSQITVPSNVRLLLSKGATFIHGANVKLFRMKPRSAFLGGFVDVSSTSLATWTQTAFEFDGADSGPVFEGFRKTVVETTLLGRRGVGTGKVFHLHATGAPSNVYGVEVDAGFDGFEIGVHLENDSAGTDRWVNGNYFNLRAKSTVNLIKQTTSVDGQNSDGNVFDIDYQTIAPHTSTVVTLVGRYNQVRGMIWDFGVVGTAVSMSAASANNFLQVGGVVDAVLSDLGPSNTILSPSGPRNGLKVTRFMQNASATLVNEGNDWRQSNNKSLQWLDSGGTARSILTLTTANNTTLSAPAGQGINHVSDINQWFISGGFRASLDNTATAGNTPLMLWDVSAGTLKRVSIGAADSGGAGFKVLRVPN